MQSVSVVKIIYTPTVAARESNNHRGYLGGSGEFLFAPVILILINKVVKETFNSFIFNTNTKYEKRN